uniref:Eukaryotic translation initiation factor 3 subunit C N-terminal domain-containing protein n=1 Tax=Gallus gallus TaxID=9031 RepID=A0A8V0X4N2_CHICK
MHINLELLECVYLVAAMLLEIPYMAAHEFDARRRMISKQFHHQLRVGERQPLLGPPESMREHCTPYPPVHPHSSHSMAPYGSQCLPMAPYGSLWLPMGPNASQCLPMGPNASLWVPMAPYGSQCPPTPPYGSQWLPMGPSAFLWVPMAPYGSQWLPMGPNGSLWVPMGPNGSLWVPTPPYGSQWLPMGPNGSLWVPMPPNVSQCLPMGPSGSQCLPLGPNGSLWVSMGPNGCLWLPMGPNGSLWGCPTRGAMGLPHCPPGPPESMREHVVAASKAMKTGDWRSCHRFIVNEKMNGKVWDLFPEADKVRAMLVRKIQEESLRTYLFTYSSVYDSIRWGCPTAAP